MALTPMLPCGNCWSRVQVSTMRYDLSGKKLMCTSCYEKGQDAQKQQPGCAELQ